MIDIKEGISYKVRKDLEMYKTKELESKFIEVINAKGPNDIVGTVYCHPSMQENEFTENYLPSFMTKLSKGSKRIFISGDFNYMLNIESHSRSATLFDIMRNNFLLPSINKPTHINRVRSTLIDNIFTNDIHPDSISGNFTVNFSDGHLPSFLLTPKSTSTNIPKQHNIMVRNLKNLDTNAFLTDYDSHNWNEILDIDKQDVDYSIESYLGTLNSVLDRHAPLRRKTAAEIKQSFKPWIKNDILHKIKVKERHYKKYSKCQNEIRKADYLAKYKELKHEIDRTLD